MKTMCEKEMHYTLKQSNFLSAWLKQQLGDDDTPTGV
jgi:hypothetical protein